MILREQCLERAVIVPGCLFLVLFWTGKKEQAENNKFLLGYVPKSVTIYYPVPPIQKVAKTFNAKDEVAPQTQKGKNAYTIVLKPVVNIRQCISLFMSLKPIG